MGKGFTSPLVIKVSYMKRSEAGTWHPGKSVCLFLLTSFGECTQLPVEVVADFEKQAILCSTCPVIQVPMSVVSPERQIVQQLSQGHTHKGEKRNFFPPFLCFLWNSTVNKVLWSCVQRIQT